MTLRSAPRSVFPGHQGGPHNHTIGALTVALKQTCSDEFKEYQHQVVRNCAAMVSGLQKSGFEIVSGGTDNHLALVDLHEKGEDNLRVERVLELANVALNKNTVPGDKSAMVPGEVRVGSPSMTLRGLDERLRGFGRAICRPNRRLRRKPSLPRFGGPGVPSSPNSQ